MRRRKQSNSRKLLSLIMSLCIILVAYYFIKNIKIDEKPEKIIDPISSEYKIDTAPISFETRSRSDELQKFTYDIKYPYFNIAFIDQDIKKMIDDNFKEFEKDAIKNELFGEYKFNFVINFENYLVSKDIVSIKFIVSSFLGGAHGIHEVVTRNYNLKSQEKMTLDSIFKNKEYLPYISEKAISKLLQENVSDENWIKNGAGATKENFKNFTISENGKSMIFHFSHYQVAPYYLGIIPFSVELEELKAFLK